MQEQKQKKFRGKISRKIILGMLVVSLVPTAFAGVYSYLYSEEILVNASLEQSLHDNQAIAKGMYNVLDGFERTVIFLGNTPPIQGIIRAKQNNGVDPLDSSTVEEWEDRLATIFIELLQANPSLLQARYIDEMGNELVRVDSDRSVPIQISSNFLQNKQDRYYFTDTMLREEGEVFVSPLDLNREGSPPQIQVPHTPVIRYAVPVFDKISGDRKGIVILNVKGEEIIDVIEKSVILEGSVERKFLVNQDGYFLHHPEKEKEWGGPLDLNTGENIVRNFSVDFSSTILSGAPGTHETVAGENYIVSYYPIFPDEDNPDRFWVLFVLFPRDIILASTYQLRDILLIIAIGFSMIAVLFAAVFSRSISRPIKKLTRMARALADGNLLSRSRVKSRDEIGALSQAVNSMADAVLESQAELESKVVARTQDLDKQLRMSEQTRKAVMNILRDVEEQKHDLENMQRATMNLMEDINDEKENVAKEKDKINAILHSIGDGVFVIDGEGVVFMYNKAAEKITGFPREEVIGKSYENVLKFVYKKEDIPEDVFIKSSIATGEVRELPMHCAIKKKNNDMVSVSATAAPLKDKDEQQVIGSVVVFRDISKEAAIDKAKTEFVSLASHQLRTPLSTINWYAEMLLDGDAGDMNEEQKKYLEEIYTGNQRMVALVNSLLNVSRLELGTFAVSPEDMDLVAEAQSVLKELSPQISAKKQKVKTSFAKIPTISADPNLTRMIFQNLLSNAIKYTPEEGIISVAISMEQEFITIDIQDTGYGIPEGQQDKIFTKLFRADNVKEKDTTGTGLGLYIIKSIVDHVGGKIWFESEEDKGTTFHVQLPKTGMEKREGSKQLGA